MILYSWKRRQHYTESTSIRNRSATRLPSPLGKENTKRAEKLDFISRFKFSLELNPNLWLRGMPQRLNMRACSG